MDPLCSVFSITGSDSGSVNGDIMVHPGDSASPLESVSLFHAKLPVANGLRCIRMSETDEVGNVDVLFLARDHQFHQKIDVFPRLAPMSMDEFRSVSELQLFFRHLISL